MASSRFSMLIGDKRLPTLTYVPGPGLTAKVQVSADFGTIVIAYVYHGDGSAERYVDGN